MEIENIINNIKNGDKENMPLLIKKFDVFFKSRAHDIIKKFPDVSIAKDDLVGVFKANMLDAVMKYDEERSKSFSSFLSAYSKNIGINYCRKFSSKKHSLTNYSYKDEQSFNYEEGSISADESISEEERLELREQILNCLGKKTRDAKIIEDYLDELSMEDIMEKNNISKTSYYRILSESKKKLRKCNI